MIVFEQWQKDLIERSREWEQPVATDPQGWSAFWLVPIVPIVCAVCAVVAVVSLWWKL